MAASTSLDEPATPSGAESKSEEMTAGKGKRRSNDFVVLLRIFLAAL